MVPALVYRRPSMDPSRRESPTKPGFIIGSDIKGSDARGSDSREHSRFNTSATHLDARPPPLQDSLPLDPCVAVVGVGFVGESLLQEFSRVFPTIGYDVSASRLEALTAEYASRPHPVTLTTDPASLRQATHILVAVPTLLRADRSIDLSHIEAALSCILPLARPGTTVVLESSVAVGTTRRLLSPHSPRLHVGMSPERVDPGRTDPPAHAIPKLISGLTPAALKSIERIYSRVFDTVIPVSSPECAELTKLYENSFRMVNIAYANEMADFARARGVDPAEMQAAAATKPYGFMPFSHGLGVGGHCIPVNPYYLLAGAARGQLSVLERATRNMWARPGRLARRFHRRAVVQAGRNRVVESGYTPMNGVNGNGVDGSGSEGEGIRTLPRVLVVGIGFKPGQSVLSCSPGLAFASALRDLGCARLAFYDPLVSAGAVPWMDGTGKENWNREAIEAGFDAVAVCVEQEGVDVCVLEGVEGVFVRSFVK